MSRTASSYDELAIRTNLRVRPVFAPPSAVREALRRTRVGEESLDDLLKHAADDEEAMLVPASGDEDEDDEDGEGQDGPEVLTLDAVEDAPIIRLLNLILSDAVRQGASDIHIEPEKAVVRVRFRVDGRLRKALDVPVNVRKRILSRLKIVSGLSTIEAFPGSPQGPVAPVRCEI